MVEALWIHHMVSWTSVLHLTWLQMASKYTNGRIADGRVEDIITDSLNIFHHKKLIGKLWMDLSILKIIRCNPNQQDSCFEEHKTTTNEDTWYSLPPTGPDSQYCHAPFCLSPAPQTSSVSIFLVFQASMFVLMELIA